MDDVITLLPNSRRGWAWAIIIVGVLLGAVVWFAGPPVSAVAGTVGGGIACVFGVIALLDRARGGWWALLGMLAIAAGVGGFALLRTMA